LFEPRTGLIRHRLASCPDLRNCWFPINRTGTPEQLRLWGRLVFHRQLHFQLGWLGVAEQLQPWDRLVFHRQRRYQLGWLGAPEQLRLWDRLV